MGRKMVKNEKFIEMNANGEEIWKKIWKLGRLEGEVGLLMVWTWK